ncbi:MAG: hypothetical protein IJZ68_07685 [Bacteroidaceae bacterium]|nr:hypothetical protein [Bacteroidaceae bacterium]
MLTRVYFGVFDGTRIIQRGDAGCNAVLLKGVRCVTTQELYDEIAVPLNAVIGKSLPQIQRGDNVVMRLVRRDNSSPPYVESFYIVPHWYQSVPAEQWDDILNDLQKRERQP